MSADDRQLSCSMRSHSRAAATAATGKAASMRPQRTVSVSRPSSWSAPAPARSLPAIRCSASASASASCVIGGCGDHLKNFDLAAWRRGEPLCPVGPLYRALLEHHHRRGRACAPQRADRPAARDLAAAALGCRRSPAQRSASPPISSRRSCCIRCIRASAASSATSPSSSACARFARRSRCGWR